MAIIGTYTFTVLEVSESTFKEISEKLKKAGWEHSFHTAHGLNFIDMHGIAIKSEEEPPAPEDETLYERKEPTQFPEIDPGTSRPINSPLNDKFQ